MLSIQCLRTIRGRDRDSTCRHGEFAGRYHAASYNSNSNYDNAARKNPKRVAAGKRTAEKTRQAREQQKKAAAEASVIIANNKANATAAAPEQAPTPEKNSGLSINQWIAVGGLAVSLASIYYKREELKAAFSKKPPEPAPASVEPKPARAPQRKEEGLRKMV